MSSTVSLNGWSPGELVLWVLILIDRFIIGYAIGELADDLGLLDGHEGQHASQPLCNDSWRARDRRTRGP